MKLHHKIYSRFIGIFFILLLLNLSSCIDSDNLKIDSETSKLSRVRFNLSVPREYVVTRSMSDLDTYKIDFNSLNVFMFSDKGYHKSCKVLLDKVVENPAKKTYTVELEIPEDNIYVDFLFFINTKNIDEPNPLESKEDYLNRTTLELNGRWKSDRLIPMWGEIQNVFIDENAGTKYAQETNQLNVSLIRALARIDVIFKNKVSTGTEMGYKLKDLYIYNSNSKFAVAPFIDNYTNNTAVKPSIPQSNSINLGENGDGLIYFNMAENDRDLEGSGLTLIAEHKAKNTHGDDMCLVIGVEYADGTLKYSKIDLHKKEQKGYKVIDILRNHRYIINIESINGLGKNSIKDALQVSGANVDVEVIEWDESINDGYVSGSEYLGIDTESLIFNSHISGEVLEVNYNSNLSENELDRLEKHFEWKNNSGNFRAYIDKKNSKIIIETIENNAGVNYIDDVLIIKATNYSFEIPVKQSYRHPSYKLNCDDIKVEGLYSVNTKLTNKNVITLFVVSGPEGLDNLTYELSTDEIDHISFEGKGTFSNGRKLPNGNIEYKVMMFGKGIPQSKLTKTLTIKTNSDSFTTCTVDIKMNYSPKFLLALENGNTTQFRAGYVLNENTRGVDTGSSKFRKSNFNFGLEQISKVKVPEFVKLSSYRYVPSSGGGFFNGNVTNSDLKRLLTGGYGKIPDIIVSAGFYKVTKTNADILANYVINGGCYIFMSEVEEEISAFFKALYVNDPSVNTANIKTIADAGETTRYQLVTHINDPVYNGPFGNLNGMFWAENFGTTDALIGIPEKDVVAYSYSVPIGTDEQWTNKGLTMFRHTKYNLIFIGNGGFLSNDGTPSNNNSRDHYAFTINLQTGEPISKDFNSGSAAVGGKVHNSIIFANMLSWMIDQAEFKGVNSGY